MLREAFKVLDYFFCKPEQAHFSTEATVKDRLLQRNMKNSKSLFVFLFAGIQRYGM